MKSKDCILYCNCGGGIISNNKQELIANAVKKVKLDVIELHDFCAFSVNEKARLNSIENEYDKKFIVACYPGAIKNIMRQNNINLSHYIVLNYRKLSSDEIQSQLNNETFKPNNEPRYEVLKSKLDVPAWYPVIDEDRCTHCGQCARFCVFGVYKFNKKNLKVANPLSCKNNCPACGRTCPASAIIFPKLPENSALSGETPGKMQVSVEKSKPEGLFAMLNERNNNRRNIFKDGIMQQAEAEKMKAIEAFKKELKNKK